MVSSPIRVEPACRFTLQTPRKTIFLRVAVAPKISESPAFKCNWSEFKSIDFLKNRMFDLTYYCYLEIVMLCKYYKIETLKMSS